MKKQSWPWIGTTEHEMGSGAPKGDPHRSDRDRKEDSHTFPDMLSPEKYITDYQVPPSYRGGLISPVDGLSEEVALADDDRIEVDILSEDDILASFVCDVAKSNQKKIIGLQRYTHLSKDAGLVFQYQDPEDVLYHMGTVTFPIDIIFADKNLKIKKIQKNIEPGTLATFGCSNTMYVLEVCGGLSDELNIYPGCKLSFKLIKAARLFHKSIITKYVSKDSAKFWKGHPIISIGKHIKEASSKRIISELIQSQEIKDNTKYVYFLDGLLKDASITTFEEGSDIENPMMDVSGKAVPIKTSSKNKVALADLKEEIVLYSFDNGVRSLLRNSKETINLLDKLKEHSSKGIIIATSLDKTDRLKELLSARINLHMGYFKPLNIDIMKIPKEANYINIVDSLSGDSNVELYADNSILKRAGIPVPDNVKEIARRVYNLLTSSEEVLEKSVNNMKVNLLEYNKIKDDSDEIAKTQNAYNESVKRNTVIVRDYLLKLRDAIKLLNQIKDVSTTMSIIDSLASSARLASEAVETIFDLESKLNMPDFYILLSDKVNKYERRAEDLVLSIERAREYINKDILGLLVLSS